MSERQFLSHSITQLEALFESGCKDEAMLTQLRRELRHRKSDRATRLQQKVQTQIELIGGSQAVTDSGDGAKETKQDTKLETELHPVNDEQSISEERGLKTTSKENPGEPNNLPPPLKLSFEDRKAPNHPLANDDPAGILMTWTALEALSPQTYRRPLDLASGDRRRLAVFDRGEMPWPKGGSIKGCRLYYQVPLGAIHMGQATKALVKKFGADEELNARQHERSVVAAVLVDREGVPLEEKSVGISSFAWALPQVLKGRISALGDWVNAELSLVEALSNILIRRDQEGCVLPLDAERIDIAYRWLVRQFDLDIEMVERASFATKVFHPYRSKKEPEVSLLNSFFLRDLDRAKEAVMNGTAPEGLARYLRISRPTETRDLLTDRSAIEDALAPSSIPPVRWPSPGGYPLVTLQQAAVNLARSELGERKGVLAVNGPPGTGKTTLLRDLVAGCVLDRALAMSQFDQPENAFKASGERLAFGGGSFLHLYKLDPSIKGHEIVVASSNNKAVENVSRELPERDAIGRDVAYFRSLSDRIQTRAGEVEPDGAETPEQEEPEPDGSGEESGTWGLIAAVLGNTKNRRAFVDTFWWDENFGFKTYLKAARGQSVMREIRGEDDRIVRRILPEIVRCEVPPNPEAALKAWGKARRRLRDLHTDVCAELEQIDAVHRAAKALNNTRIAHEKRSVALPLVSESVSVAEFEAEKAASAQTETEAALTKFTARLARHDHERPGWIARLLRTRRYGAWREERASLLVEQSEAAERNHASISKKNDADAMLADTKEHLGALRRKIAVLESQIEEQEEQLAPWYARIGDRFVDDAFFKRGHEAWNLAAPWVPDALHEKREALFEAALDVHRAFVDASAQKVQHNLGVLMDVMQKGGVSRLKHRALLPDLWSTLFSVVPVVSTTFASVDRMMGELDAEAFGWLLIDEAGQAVPQAAVGAIHRARRTIVVGDPLQVPPVATLPKRLIEAICDAFSVDSYDWAAPEASTQTLADHASRFQASFRGDVEPRRVGVPLLVHRRCQNPMFGVSNEIAYDCQMVHAAGPPKNGLVTATLGPSRWLDVEGEAETKWCPADGEMVVRLLRRLANESVQKPDVFIISPFRDVVSGIRTRLRDEASLFAALGVEPQAWLQDRIGTVHTVQGREAEAVILVLGAPASTHASARAWASNTPNILNVAVSRAKQSLYVVGSHGAWSAAGYARTMANALPVARDRTRSEAASP